jgi:hypothetical protein
MDILFYFIIHGSFVFLLVLEGYNEHFTRILCLI